MSNDPSSTPPQPEQAPSPAQPGPTATPSVPSGPSRRRLLQAVAAGVGVAAIGGGTAALIASRRGDDNRAAGTLRPVKLGWWGATCEAPLYVAYQKGFFARAGLDVELVNLGQASAKDAIASGKVDGAPGITFEWLKPIEQGQDIRVVGGLHGGCLRLVTGSKTGISSLEGLRGKTLATDQIGGSAHSFFSVVLAQAGIDPSNDVKFVAYPGAQLQTALKRGEVVAVAAADPFPFLIVADGDGQELASNLTGAYKDHYCCAIGLNGKLIDSDPATAKAVTNAWLSAAKWIGSNVEETAEIEVRNKYVPIEAAVAAKLLSTYFWIPSVTGLQANVQQYAQEFKTTNILDKGTDPNALAAKAFHDITGGDAGIDASTPTVTPRGSVSGSATNAYGLRKQLGSATYQLTAAQHEALEHLGCHKAASLAGRV